MVDYVRKTQVIDLWLWTFFVTQVIWCFIESVRNVSLLPSHCVTVWFGQKVRRNGIQL